MKGERFHHGNLREAIIKEAKQTIKKQGIEAFSLRNIAKEIGVSPGAPYRHFKNKDALIKALVEDASSTFMQMYDSKKSAKLSDENHVKLICESYINHAQKDPHIYKLVFTDKYAPIESNIAIITEDSGYLLFENLISKLIPDDVPKRRYRERSISCWLMLHGFVSMNLATDLTILDYRQEQVIGAVIALARSPNSHYPKIKK